MSTPRPLDTAIAEAVRGAVPRIIAARPHETLNGFALCTDDDLCTLYHVASSREFCRSHASSPEVEFQPTEWTYSEGGELFDEARKMVRSRYDESTGADEFSRHERTTFRDMVSALLTLRKDGLFPAELFLSVLSTDPGPDLERMERDAVELLNAPSLVARWRDACE